MLEGEETLRIEAHLAECADCRRYAEELQVAADGLRWLATRPAEPSPGFRARWTRAVEEAAQAGSVGEVEAVLASWWRSLLQRNLRPALGVASLWILTLLFRLSAPEVAPPTHGATAHSPLEIYHVLDPGERLVAARPERESPVQVVPRSTQPPRPRSEGLSLPLAERRARAPFATL